MLTTEGLTFATRSANEAGAPGTTEIAGAELRCASAVSGCIITTDAVQASPAAAKATGFHKRLDILLRPICE
jgi:hypothetical protein